MNYLHFSRIIGSVAAFLAFPVNAQDTVECHSRNYEYDECFAGNISRPQLVHQISSSACIINRTWGYNPTSQYIWVSRGCSGVFADVGGYHYGRGDDYDPGARHYDERGHDLGSVLGGVVLGVLIEDMTSDTHKRSHTNSNYPRDSRYNGCYGNGCQVDRPNVNIDKTPQYDKNGEPNFDINGGYIGCHGIGCLVDDPEVENRG
ncbi:MAG: DUF3011 domain-containing protein [Comamonas thiooxydans]